MLWSELNEEETNKMIKKALNHIEKNSEHSLSWSELKEEAKKMGATVFDRGSIFFSHLQFEEDGGIYVDPAHYDWETLDENICISSDRTPDEMLAIMKALQ